MKRYILYSLSGLAALSAHSQNTSNENVSPNILLIVVDDMGFSDTQPFGGETDCPGTGSWIRGRNVCQNPGAHLRGQLDVVHNFLIRIRQNHRPPSKCPSAAPGPAGDGCGQWPP